MKQHIQLVPGQRVHFIGIGGAGMSAIARVLLLQGFQVSGSDLKINAETEALHAEGVRVYHSHDAAHVSDAELVIATSAVPDDHIEILAAQARNIPVYRRREIMSTIMSGYVGVAIAGTHGKTTTTSMSVHILQEAGHSPTYIVGGVMGNNGTNAGVGTGRTFVIEADEYDNMFHGLLPRIEVLTNVEFDHPDFFNTPDELLDSFRQFVELLPEDGLLVACADDETARKFARDRQNMLLPTILYGIANDADWQATNIFYQGTETKFDVLHDNEKMGSVVLQVPGKHNILNALAAIIVADHEGVPFAIAAAALSRFKGTGRRFEIRYDQGGIAIIDDYAHHPTAIRLTIDAARQRFPDREVWAVWQPHTYSRTRQLWDEFLMAFGQAHHVIVTDIYAARESLNPDVRAVDFVQALQHANKFHSPTLDDAVTILSEYVQAPAAVLIMSAGDAPQIGIDYLRHLKASAP